MKDRGLSRFRYSKASSYMREIWKLERERGLTESECIYNLSKAHARLVELEQLRGGAAKTNTTGASVLPATKFAPVKLTRPQCIRILQEAFRIGPAKFIGVPDAEVLAIVEEEISAIVNAKRDTMGTRERHHLQIRADFLTQILKQMDLTL